MHTTYIIYSEKLDRYYTGSTTVSIESRLYRHNINHKGFTGKVDDWRLIYTKEFGTVQESRKLEKEIKKRGAVRYLYDIDV